MVKDLPGMRYHIVRASLSPSTIKQDKNNVN